MIDLLLETIILFGKVPQSLCSLLLLGDQSRVPVIQRSEWPLLLSIGTNNIDQFRTPWIGTLLLSFLAQKISVAAMVTEIVKTMWQKWQYGLWFQRFVKCQRQNVSFKSTKHPIPEHVRCSVSPCCLPAVSEVICSNDKPMPVFCSCSWRWNYWNIIWLIIGILLVCIQKNLNKPWSWSLAILLLIALAIRVDF